MIVVCTNERAYLLDCLPSLLGQDHPDFEVLVVDNASTDGSPELVERDFPAVRLVRNAANLGYVGANNAGFREARGALLVVVNPDTEAAPGWLSALDRGLAAHPEAGLATSRIALFDRRELLNTCGNVVHVTGIGFCRGLNRPLGSYPEPGPVASVSGCAFAIRREVLEEIGGFDEDFFAYVEDTDLSLRAALAGYSCLYVPDSVIYHRYALRMRPQKFFFLERNRLLLLLKHLRPGTLAALLPALLAGEFLTGGFALLRGPGYVAAKLRAWGWIARNRGRIRAGRARVQALRRVPDSQLLALLTPVLPGDQLLGGGRVAALLAGAATAVFSVLYGFARLVVR